MDNVNFVVSVINDSIKETFKNKKLSKYSVFGICETALNKKNKYPALFSLADSKPIVLDVTASTWIYHKLTQTTYSTIRNASFGRNNAQQAVTNLRMIIAFNRLLNITQSDMELIITSSMVKNLSPEQLLKLNLKSVNISVVNASYDGSAIYRNEWGNNESNLTANYSFVQLDYRITCLSKSECAIPICCN